MGRLGKKVLSWMLCLMMAVGMLPGMSLRATADSGEYVIDMSGVSEDVKVDSGTGGGKPVVVTGASVHYLIIEAKEGEEITVLFRDVDIYGVPHGTPGVFVQGDGIVTIQLEGDNTVEGAFDCAGIQKSDKVALTITSSAKGKLSATGGVGGGAGIGGGYGDAGSNITISGDAQVTAIGGGAGIGGGEGGVGSDITISGNAIVMAKGGESGAGIGGGYKGAGSDITISGDVQVTATGGYYGAGIGGGMNGASSGITISGKGNAQVTATGGEFGAGIGGGSGGAGSNIAISGDAQVTAIGGDRGAGIGGGKGGAGSDITINVDGDAQVTATGGACGAGIGGGEGGDGSNITISGNAQVTANGGKFGAGIGGGGGSAGSGITINIDGIAQVTANGGAGGAGIGGGHNGKGSDITISGDGDAQVTAIGGADGAGIGGGYLRKGSDITISIDGNAQVTANGGTGGAGIGGGASGEGSEITISGDGNAQVTATGGAYGAGIGGGEFGKGSDITISIDGNAQVTANGGAGGAGIGGGDGGEGSGITISGDGNAQVTATGGESGAGIGGGRYGGEGSNITISGDGNAQVTATGGSRGAGIGGGSEGKGYGITIRENAQVTATGGAYGAGIGGGSDGDGSGIIITISGDAKATAIGGYLGAGIGGGAGGDGSDITISGDGNAQVTATGGESGAGIGGGCDGKGSGIKVYDQAIVSVSGGEGNTSWGSGAGVGDGGKYDGNGNPPEGNEAVITFTDDDHKTFNGNVLYYEKGSSAESIEKEKATRINSATVTLIANDGTDTFTEQTVSVGVPTNLQENPFTRKGHSFTGWNTQADGKGTSYKDQTQRIWEPNTILYVQWTDHVYDQTVADETKYRKDAATCTKAAVYYKSCSCGAFDPDESGTFESGEALGHDYKDVAGTAKKASCTETGKEADQECSRCHDVITGAEIAKLTHTFDQEVATDKYLKTPADCTHKAVYYKSCTCGEKGTETFEFGEVLGHDYKDVAGTAKKATCTETGKEADQECSRCHDVITGAEIAKLTHTFDQEVATDKYLKTPADCTHKAVYYKSCTCGEKGTETFESGEVLGHDYKDVAGTAKKATCTETGKEADQECSRCHDVIIGAEIAKLTHTFDQEVATDKYLKTPADCTHKAVYYKSCTCGEKGTETFESGEALGHTWKAATGYAPKTCEICGETEGDVIKYTPEDGKILEHTQGDTTPKTIVYHRSEDDNDTFSHYVVIRIDGNDVLADAKSGSVIITLDAATLNALNVGDHVITVTFDDWIDEMKLVIKAPVEEVIEPSPTTGDTSTPALWAALVLLSMAGASAVVIRRRKQA